VTQDAASSGVLNAVGAGRPLLVTLSSISFAFRSQVGTTSLDSSPLAFIATMPRLAMGLSGILFFLPGRSSIFGSLRHDFAVQMCIANRKRFDSAWDGLKYAESRTSYLLCINKKTRPLSGMSYEGTVGWIANTKLTPLPRFTNTRPSKRFSVFCQQAF
jgi:hypothetical protein